MARILLIEDDDDVRTMLRTTLVAAGHTVVESRDGREGLKLFRQAGADLVITDIVMPEMDGLGVLMEFRKAHPTVKVIGISGGGVGGSGTDYLDLAKKLGASTVLPKPFQTAALLEAIDRLLSNTV